MVTDDHVACQVDVELSAEESQCYLTKGVKSTLRGSETFANIDCKQEQCNDHTHVSSVLSFTSSVGGTKIGPGCSLLQA